jgi:N-acetylglucosamine-6-sulfatase
VVAFACALLCALALAPAAEAREEADRDKQPNILVVMTDDMATTDVALMPNVRKLLARKGTTFADAVDSFPLCCPARATFITGQYAHNHGVRGNFHPYGWYGMKQRGNTLPRWLQDAGYTTAMIGKWLNGYGAADGHGEVPKGFDIWRGLLDVSAYDYFNFVMNRDGKLRSWGDVDFAAKLVEFAKIQVIGITQPGEVFAKLHEVFGDPPYSYWGAEDAKDYSPDVTGKVTENLVKQQARSEDPWFIWWSVAAPHREDVSTTLMGRPGPDPRPAPRYADESQSLTLPRPPSFNEADISDKGSSLQNTATPLTDEEIAQLELDYQGRGGSLMAVDEHVGKLVKILKQTDQLDDTMIVFLSDNGWLQGEHRIPGDKFLPYEESLRVPLIIRGPGVPKNRTVRGQVSNIDFAPTLLDAADAKAGRTMDGVSLLPTMRKPSKRPDRALMIEALAPLFAVPLPANEWDRPWTGVRTDRYTYVVWTETGEQELYDRETDPYQLTSVAADPAYATIKAELAAKLEQLADCAGRSCNVAP